MFLIDIAGLKILYTGDYSREEDRHLVKAEVPPIRPDVLIVESTFGVQTLEGREEKELRFTNLVHNIIRRGGHVLLPTFALGRAQELLLILDEYWKKHPDLHNVPVYYASSLARKCMAVYQTYIHTMNTNVRSRFAKRDNPFVFKHISNVPHSRGWERKIAEGPPCVVLASPGFMDSGPSRELLELWAPDSRNGVILTGYSIEGTMARDIQTDPDEIPSVKGGHSIPRKLSVDEISFGAHVDYSQNSEFIEQVHAQHIVLVHGEQNAMVRLRAALQDRYKNRDEDVKIHTPRNLEPLELTFRGERVAKAIGTLAAKPPQPNEVISGLLVSKDYSYTLLDPRDLRDFAGLTTTVVTQRQKIALNVGWELVRWHLEGMYGKIEEGVDKDGVPTMRVMGAVDVKQTSEHELTLEWDSSASNDMIADSTLALITGIDKSPASVKLTTQPHSHAHSHAPGLPHPHAEIEDEQAATIRIQRLAMFLEAHFGEVEFHQPDEESTVAEGGENPAEPALLVRLDEADAVINLLSMTVTSSSDVLRKRVEAVLEMALSTISSLSESFTSAAPLSTEEPAPSTEKESPSAEPEALESKAGEAAQANGASVSETPHDDTNKDHEMEDLPAEAGPEEGADPAQEPTAPPESADKNDVPSSADLEDNAQAPSADAPDEPTEVEQKASTHAPSPTKGKRRAADGDEDSEAASSADEAELEIHS